MLLSETIWLQLASPIGSCQSGPSNHQVLCISATTCPCWGLTFEQCYISPWYNSAEPLCSITEIPFYECLSQNLCRNVVWGTANLAYCSTPNKLRDQNLEQKPRSPGLDHTACEDMCSIDGDGNSVYTAVCITPLIFYKAIWRHFGSSMYTVVVSRGKGSHDFEWSFKPFLCVNDCMHAHIWSENRWSIIEWSCTPVTKTIWRKKTICHGSSDASHDSPMLW